MKSAFDIARWFIENNPFLSCYRKGYKDNHLKLQKLLHYSNILMQLINQKPLFEEEVVAYKEGFVVEDFYEKFRSHASEIYNRELKQNFNDKETEILNLTNILFGYMTGKELSVAVHLDDIWDKYEEESQICGSHKILDIKDIFDFYGKQSVFLENVKYIRQNLNTEIEKIKNIKADKFNSVDDVYFYYDQNFVKDKETEEIMKQICKEYSDDCDVKYFYLSRESDGALYVE
jgi:uncharacterized phage-associated protein